METADVSTPSRSHLPRTMSDPAPTATAPQATPARSFTGLSILALVVAMLVVAMGASFAIPAFFKRPSVTLESAVELFAKDVLDLQNQAVLNFERVELRFLDEGDGYTGHHRDGRLLAAPTGNGTFEREYSFNAVFRGVRIDTIQLGDGGDVLAFDRRGHASTDLRLVFAYEGATCEVHVEDGSGRVVIGEVTSDTDGR